MKILRILLVLTVVGLAACAPSKTGTEGKSKARKSLEFKGDQGKLVIDGSGKSLPSNFPDDMPIFKPSRVKSTVNSRGQKEATMTMAILQTSINTTDVSAFYQTNLPAKGWTINSTACPEPGVTVLAATKDNQVGSISIGLDKETKATIISINVTSK